jgi:hypothetical protein
MITAVDFDFCQQVKRFTLRFCCDDCIHYNPAGGECSLGYCAAPHVSPSVTPGGNVVFCKTFELK